ncbi:MAG: 30S ribosomal protein S8, partial [Dolichospermum sp.]
MASKDTIADMLTRIRNANMAKHQTTQVPATKMTRSIAKVLREEGFIAEVEEAGEGVKRNLVISLKYKGKNRQPLIT